jgi:tRNA pseudouridine55 synthase
MGRRRNPGRNVSGILLLDKPLGMTSNEALQKVKHLFRARKAGHTGSLDPLATGLLPLCFGDATKLSAFLLDADKHYQVKVKLGVTTTTADAEGEVLETRPTDAVGEAAVREVCEGFIGDIEQLPPMYSAIKHQGERLYKLARQGIEVERTPRRIQVFSLEMMQWGLPEFWLKVHCSKGTYVRTLVEDIGHELGCGAHVSGLRRTGVGPYGEEGMVSMEQLEALAQQGGLSALDGALLPMESALSHWPEVKLSDDAAYYMKMGQAVLVPQAPTQGWVRIHTKDGRFIGVGSILDDGKVQPKRLLQAD